jgi:hypothetical protein
MYINMISFNLLETLIVTILIEMFNRTFLDLKFEWNDNFCESKIIEKTTMT